MQERQRDEPRRRPDIAAHDAVREIERPHRPDALEEDRVHRERPVEERPEDRHEHREDEQTEAIDPREHERRRRRPPPESASARACRSRVRKSSAICVAAAKLARSAVRSANGSCRTIWAIGVTKSDFSQSPITQQREQEEHRDVPRPDCRRRPVDQRARRARGRACRSGSRRRSHSTVCAIPEVTSADAPRC